MEPAARFFFSLFFSAALCAAHKFRGSSRPEWDLKNEAEKVTTRGCANLTLVLDNWKFAIVSQVKDLLLHDHNTVLPDYGRIQHLSDALGDLYKEFNAMKDRLAELTARFDAVEGFVDSFQTGRKPVRRRGDRRPEGALLGNVVAAGGQPQGRKRSRVVIRKIVRPAA